MRGGISRTQAMPFGGAFIVLRGRARSPIRAARRAADGSFARRREIDALGGAPQPLEIVILRARVR